MDQNSDSLKPTGLARVGVLVTGNPESATRLVNILERAADTNLWLITAAIAIAVYGSELANFTLSIDEELHAFNSEMWSAWIAQGRWGMALISWMLPPLSNTPFLPTAIFVAGLVASAVLLSTSYSRSRHESIVFAGFFVSCPLWLHIGEFNTMSAGFAVGMVLATVAILLLLAGGLRAAIVAGVLGGIAIGVYQSFILFIVCGSLIGAAFQIVDGTHRRRQTLIGILQFSWPFVLSWLIAMGIYFGVTLAVLIVTKQSIAYVDTLLHIDEFRSASTFWLATDRTGSRIGQLATGTDPTFLTWGKGSLLMAWLGGMAFVYRALLWPNGRIVTRSVGALFGVGAIFVALLPFIASAGYAPLRALTALPLLYAVAGASLMRHGALTQISWMIFGYGVLVNTWIGATLFHADAIAGERDRSLATKISERIEALPGYEPEKSYPLVVIGSWSHEVAGPAMRVEVFGTSFFEHDGGNPWRIANYLRLHGTRGLTGMRIIDIPDQVSQFEVLPNWPDSGSVALMEGRIVLKLSPLSYAQRAALGPNR